MIDRYGSTARTLQYEKQTNTRMGPKTMISERTDTTSWLTCGPTEVKHTDLRFYSYFSD